MFETAVSNVVGRDQRWVATEVAKNCTQVTNTVLPHSFSQVKVKSSLTFK